MSDDVQQTERRAAHRRPTSAAVGVSTRVFIVVLAVVAAALVFATVRVIGSSVTAVSQQSAQAQPAPGAEGDGEAESAPSASPTPAESVDPDALVAVLNSTSRAGLAGVVRDRLKAEDVTVGSVGNAQSSLTATTVFYAEKKFEASARAVAARLDDAKVEQSSRYDADVTVVVASDYRSPS